MIAPQAGRLQALSVDVLFWLRDAAFGPRHAPSDSPTIVIALDEEPYRRPPFRDLPKVFWTKRIARVLDTVIAGGAEVIGFDVVFPTSVERHLKGFDRPFLISLRTGARGGKIVLGKVQHQIKPISPFPGYTFAVGHGKNIRSLNLFEDEDGLIRRVPLLFETQGKKGEGSTEPSMALELAARAMGARPEIGRDEALDLKGCSISGGEEGGRDGMLINFDGGAGPIPAYFLADLNPSAEAGRRDYFAAHFRDKFVLIGAVFDIEDRGAKIFQITSEGGDVGLLA